ncbi:MAG TPA: ABC transporter permease [Candidatus Dormibacteraeota bacterium]|nr:ABC transporter permease [Candidatus Dormibacteraeota bacterium]
MISSSAEAVVHREGQLRVEGRARRAWDSFRSNRPALVAAGVLVVLAALAALAPWLSPYQPGAIDLRHVAEPPTLAHPLGTDGLGRDVATRIVWGGRISLAVGGGAMLIAAAIGIPYGAAAGFYGGRIDTLMMRAVDFVLCFPAIFVLLILASFHGGSVLSVVLYIGLFGWMGIARVVRGQVLSLRERDFVVAAHSLGASGWRILARHLVPNALAPVIVAVTLGMAGAMLIEAALDFLGFGVPPDTPTWGNLMTDAESYLLSAPLLAIAPGLVITVAVVSVNAVGDALRDALDPYAIAPARERRPRARWRGARRPPRRG